MLGGGALACPHRPLEPALAETQFDLNADCMVARRTFDETADLGMFMHSRV